jgi:GntR family transcriptional regulator, transcriptional repressor for pyruvate dehydrogenase complex
MSVTTQAIENIRAMIVDGRLAPGDRLPPEQELAELLGVSRGSLREAVRALSQINVLDVRRGDGTYVRSLEPSDLLSGLFFAIELLQARGLDEVLEVRRLLFPPAAGLAAQRATEEQLAAMRSVIEQLEVAVDSETIANLHREFQGIVADATGNGWLSSILRALQLEGEHVRRAWLTSKPTIREVAIAHQKLILEALERRDTEMARTIATIQVDTRRRWVEHLRESTTADDPERLVEGES